ncbi:TolB family protein [Segetibacter koreensis]|uniref:TolB family protein n=1 Tax=Segetibacter koreensis TaxID=398037 RepID=UPI000370BF3F|nr:hypothetical protein [Segetibacter koreensis]
MHKGCRYLFVVAIVLFYALPGTAQEFGGNPSSIKWRQISTDTARVIFPAGLESAGERVASIIHDLQKNHAATIGNRLKKINIVLQNQTTVSNAYVGLGPYRSEFYLFAPQNSFSLGSLNWVDNLSIHEYRHVEQYSNFDVGLSKLASILFGQQGQALANAAAVPNWFFEGDAVFNETSLSQQGRGRLPAFFNGYKSLYLEGKEYSYMKLRNGSLRHYVPDHYDLGYLLVAYGREKYGRDFWKNVTHDAAAFKPLFYPMQGAVKKFAGVSFKRFTTNAFAFYNNQWQQEKEQAPNFITPVRKNDVTNYKYPYIAADGSLVVLKTSYRHIPAFYKILADGKENKIGVRDIANDDYFSYNNGKIVYASYKADKRWGYREYSDIKLMDATTGKTKKITNKERLFSPDISHDCQKIVAVEMRPNQVSTLIVVNQKGETLFRSKAARGLVYTYPKFSANDSLIYSPSRNEDGKMTLLKIELATGKQTVLMPFSNGVIGFPTVQGDTIFFTSSFNGSDEIWAFIESKNQMVRVAKNATGYYQAVYNNAEKKLITSNFTAVGYRLASISNDSLLWQPVNTNTAALPDLYVAKALQQEDSATLENISNRNFPVRKYSKAFNLLNFHSIQPTYSDPEFALTLLGENILNTLRTEVLYTYNRNESSHRAGLTAIYGGWYIQPTISVNQTWNRNIFYNADTTFFYNELNANAGLRLPLNFSAGRQYRYLTLNGTINNQQVKWNGIGKNLLQNKNFNFWQVQLQYSGQIQKVAQHIYPRWAQTLLVQYKTILNKYSANQFLASGYLYLPGFHINHNIVLTAAYQQRDTLRQYIFSNSFPFSRGYSSFDFPRMWRFGANYHFPLLYPDWGFGNIVYFKRIRANTFFDNTWVKSLLTKDRFSFRTVGAELFFDTKWWNQQDVSFGIRYSRLLDYKTIKINQPNQWEIILPVGLY